MNATRESFQSPHADLERQIQQLKSVAGPLKDEVIVTPLHEVISAIIGLPKDLSKITDPQELHEIEMQVDNCTRTLNDFGNSFIRRIISHPKQSRVFEILSKARLFSSEIKRSVGKPLTLEDGTTIVMTAKLAEALTRYRFSIGTPPVTPKGIQTIEEILFGGGLHSIYQFRELLGGGRKDKELFDAFVANTERLVIQSTHYTTADEKRTFEKKATDFNNFEGLRGLKKSVISGTAKTAIRLIKEELFSRHSNGSHPVFEVPGVDQLNDQLITKMQEDKETIFIVRVTEVPDDIFTDDKLKEKWKGILGRLIIVDDSPNSRRAGTTFVHTFDPTITETLDILHVKDSGTPANTQMNLRSIIENFSEASLEKLAAKVQAKIADYETGNTHKKNVEEVRGKKWEITMQKDYLSLKNFLKFIRFIQSIQKADDSELAKINGKYVEENEKSARAYFYKKLPKQYQLVSVPQGGGRKELGHVGKFHSKKFQKKIEDFKNQTLPGVKERLKTLQGERGITTTDAEMHALERARIQSEDSLARIHNDGANGEETGLVDQLKEYLRTLAGDGVDGARGLMEKLQTAVETATTSNLSGQLRAEIAQKLGDNGLSSAGKLMEKGTPETLGDLMRTALGLINRFSGVAAAPFEKLFDAIKEKTQAQNLSLAEKLLYDIENGSLKPRLALSEVGWTFNDVLSEDDFPRSNYLQITLNKNGDLEPDSLKQQLESVKRSLVDFPELFELYCSSTMLIINDPHNPTSHVARNTTKFALLDIASEYGLTILADEAYHKQVEKSIKDTQGDMSLAEFYQKNKTGRYLFRPVTIYSTLPTTKWAEGAGRRTGVAVTNDKSTCEGQTFIEYVRAHTDSVNTMSLYLDLASYNVGSKVKDVCTVLEPLILKEVLYIGDPIKTIDDILAKQFSDLSAPDFCAPLYFALMEARNYLDHLEVRGAQSHDIAPYISDLISKLKDFRLDKQTQRDSAERSKAANSAIERAAVQYPFLKQSAIPPEGPFYVCIKLDDAPGADPSLTPFLSAIARARNIDVVPTEKGYVRFAFGGELDGTKEGYKSLSIAIENDLSILLKYWKLFKEERAASKSEFAALKKLFPGGEIELVRTLQEKTLLTDRIAETQESKKHQLVFNRPASVSGNITSIEPDSESSIVTLREIKCNSLQELLNSREFQNLFNFYLLQIKSRIPELMFLDDTDTKAFYGARQFAAIEKKSRAFKNNEREIFGKIASEVAKVWFSDRTIKILASTEEDSSPKALLGAETILSRLINQFLEAFLSVEELKSLLAHFRNVPAEVEEYLPIEHKFPASLQAAYKAVNGVKADPKLPKWLQMCINKGEFAANSTATDPSPMLSTPGKARVPGKDRAIIRRDGDGKKAPKAEFFSNRLENFAEIMNPGDYVFKMVQIGGTKVLLVMNRSYSHYIVEELRLFPQKDLTAEDVANCKPDAVSFLGLPTKVMGEDYRLGYSFSQDQDGNNIPFSWVDAESVTDYMGYLKKPVLTVANEKVKEKEMLAVHGSAFTIVFKNGMRKTIVMGGDSGTGKSETIIAMIEQIIKNEGYASQVEGIEFLSGDMLSVFEVDNGTETPDLYMLGTEQGDFMRMTDIPADWKKRVRDRISHGSKTNLSDKKNPRITIGNLCNPMEFQVPVRINFFTNIDNYNMPAGSAMRETDDPRNLLLDEYVRGYRGEKGTSGDQPNIFASVGFTGHSDNADILEEFGEDLDEFLGWDILTGESGKAENAFLKFNDLPGKVFKAKSMIDKLFIGKEFQLNRGVEKIDFTHNRIKIAYKNGDLEEFEVPLDEPLTLKKSENKNGKVEFTFLNQAGDEFTTEIKTSKHVTVTQAEYKVRENHYYAEVEDKNGKKEKIIIDREGVFNKIYSPIASTYCGNPFVSPEGMGEILERFAVIMKKSGIITGTLHTQLKVPGMEFEGPSRAAQDFLEFCLNDTRVNARFQKFSRQADQALREKYGAAVLSSSTIPEPIMAHNLLLIEEHERSLARPVDSHGNLIVLKTPYYDSTADKEEKIFNPKLITPEVSYAISDVCDNEEYKSFNLDTHDFDITKYNHIKAYDTKEELIYQILIKHGLAQIDYRDKNIAKVPAKAIKKAEKIAKAIMERDGRSAEVKAA